ncbi:hypothetical protein BAL199_03684 [alpha proteobacterium BAL199]|nr:hypothetical protein BAL199_03684 [alpha proteobacterium BAL199]
MGIVVAFPQRPKAVAFGPEDFAALDRLVARTRHSGAVRWEIEDRATGHARAYVLGAEDETLLIVTKSRSGITVNSGYAHELLWQGDRLAGY